MNVASSTLDTQDKSREEVGQEGSDWSLGELQIWLKHTTA